MSAAPQATIYRYSWNHGKRDEIPGVLLRNEERRIFVSREQLATFADFMIDALESYEQEHNE